MSRKGGKESPPLPSTKVVVSISEERRGQVELCLRVRGLKPKAQPSKFFIRMGKPPTPGPLMSNAELKQWELREGSLHMRLAVKVAKETKKDKEHKAKAMYENAENEGQTTALTEIFEYKIGQFPCDIDPIHTKYDVCQPSGRNYSFVMVKMTKREPTVSWTSVLREQGTIDVSEDADDS